MSIKEYQKQVFDTINKSIKEWMEEHPIEKLPKEIKTILNRNRKTVTFRLLGLINEYDDWVIGPGNNPLNDHIQEAANKSIKEWFKTFKFNPPTDTFKKEIKALYKTEFENRIRRQIHQLAKDHAENFIENHLDNINLNDFEKMVDNQIKLTKLISE